MFKNFNVFPTYFNCTGNDSKVDGLVNFEKLRMIAKEIRQVVRMTSANMDPAVMFRQRYGIRNRKEWNINNCMFVLLCSSFV